jgi:hypothetical protein
MTDQTRWGIPEVQLKNKVKKYQDDNFKASLNHAKNLNGKNLGQLIFELQQLKEKKNERNVV